MMLYSYIFIFGIMLCGFDALNAGRIKRAHEVAAKDSLGLTANITAAEHNVTIAKRGNETEEIKRSAVNATAGQVSAVAVVAQAQSDCKHGSSVGNSVGSNNVTNNVGDKNAIAESRARIARHLTEAFNRRKQMRSKYHEARRTVDHESECKKHKRRTRRKPSSEMRAEDDFAMPPLSENENWEHESPERHRVYGLSDSLHSFDESPLAIEESVINGNEMPESSSLNMISLAHLLVGKQNAHAQELQTHYKEPFGGFDAEEITYFVDKPESKMSSFLRNAHTVALMEPKNKPYDFLAPNAADEEELEIRCPIHHGAGGMANIVGMCSCNIVKNKPEYEQATYF